MTIEGSTKSYISVEALTQRADVVLLGYAGAITERFIDNGNDPANPPVPGLFQTIRIEKALKATSDVTAGTEVSVSLLDTEKIQLQDHPRLEPGSRVLLFLYKAIGPIAGKQRTAFVPISEANGIFDVNADDVVKPRSSRVRAISEAAAREELNALARSSREEAMKQTEIKTFSLTEISAFVANSQ
jgi:hypothetical protein